MTGTLGTSALPRTLLAAIAAAALAIVPAADAAKPKPSLRVAKLGSPPAEVDQGGAFSVSGKVANDGERAGAATVRFALRRGPDAGPLGVTLRGRRIDEVPAGESVRFVHTVEVPADTAPGEYGLAACVRKRGATGPKLCEIAPGRVLVGGVRLVPGEDSGPTDPPPGPSDPGPTDPGAPPTQFTSGARSIGDSLFPQIGNGGYDARHYEVLLDYNPATNSLESATTTMTAKATQNLSDFSLDFQGLTVDGVRVNGRDANFSRDATKLIITPSNGIPQGSEFEAEVDYSGTPQEVTDPDGSKEGWIRNSGPVLDGAFTVNEPVGAQSWFPNNNHPTDKAAYDFEITVPVVSTALGTGELVGAGPTSNGDGTHTWHWREDDPTASYLTTATSGAFNFATRTINETTPGAPGTLIEYRAIDSSYTALEVGTLNAGLDEIPAMTNFLGEIYGPYPFESTGAVIDSAPGIMYALENQTKPHFSLPTLGALLHEVAHQWMGNSVTLASWSDIWFNEGWATWSEWCWEDSSGTSACPTNPDTQFDNNYSSGPDSKWAIAPAVLNNNPANLFSTFAVYTRGAMTLEGYRQIVGHANFVDLAKRLNTEFRHDTISTAEFIAVAKQESGFTGAQLQRLDDYFQQWLYGETEPTITPDTF
jgi:aminopeptidase N